jgi:hypothetical protein
MRLTSEERDSSQAPRRETRQTLQLGVQLSVRDLGQVRLR